MVMTIDIEAYKQRFRELKRQTTYERVNQSASMRKRYQQRLIKPLTLEQLQDDFEAVEYTTVLVSIDPHHASRRSTKAGALFGQVYTEMRVTERLAILHALGRFKFEAEDPTKRLNELPPRRWCIIGKHWKPEINFVYRPRWLHNWSYACTDCKVQQVTKVWHKKAA